MNKLANANSNNRKKKNAELPINQRSPLFPFDDACEAYEMTSTCHKGTQIFIRVSSLGTVFTRLVTLAIVHLSGSSAQRSRSLTMAER